MGGLRRRADGAIGSWIGIAADRASLVAIPLRGLYRFTGGTMEEGFMLDFPELITQGKVPNVDFLHLYGPGSLDVLAGWYRVFGNSLNSERTFGLLQHLGIIFGLFTLARPWGRAAATCVGGLAVFYVLTPDRSDGDGVERGRRPACCGPRCSPCAASTVTTQPDPVALHRRGPRRPRPHLPPRSRRRPRSCCSAGCSGATGSCARPCCIGAAVGLLPMWYHLVVAGIGPSFDGMFVDPVFRLRAGRSLPATTELGAHRRRPAGDRRADPAVVAGPPPVGVPRPVPVVLRHARGDGRDAACTRSSIRRRPGGRTGGSTVLLAVALIAVGILPQGLQRPDSTHLTWVTCMSWPFAIVVDRRRRAAGLAARRPPGGRRRRPARRPPRPR